MPVTSEYCFTKLSVLIPTRQRIDRLTTLLDSYEHTANGVYSQLVFRVDDDDDASREFLNGQTFWNRGHISTVVGPRHAGYQSMPVFFNDMLVAVSGDILMCGNDDMVFKTPGWAQMILEAANQFPDGIFDIGVDTLNETHFPFSIVSKRAVDQMGFLWDPRIFWGDIFLRDVMAHFGRCVMLPGVRIEHDWAGFRPDRVFAESDKDIIRRDPTYWTGTHATAVQEAVEKLRGMLS